MSRDRLDRLFSLYIRRRDEHRGCISCGRAITANNCDAGHYIPRAHIATRWNVYNVNAQCYECNRLKDGNITAYREGLIRKYGIDKVNELERLKHTTIKVSKSDINNYIKKLNELLNRKGI